MKDYYFKKKEALKNIIDTNIKLHNTTFQLELEINKLKYKLSPNEFIKLYNSYVSFYEEIVNYIAENKRVMIHLTQEDLERKKSIDVNDLKYLFEDVDDLEKLSEDIE